MTRLNRYLPAILMAALILFVMVNQAFQAQGATIMAAVLAIIIAWQLFYAYQNGLRFINNWVSIGLAVFLLWMFLSIGFGISKDSALMSFLQVGTLIFSFYAIIWSFNQRTIFYFASVAVIVIALISVAVGLYQLIFIPNDSMEAFFHNRNTLAAFFNLILLPLCAYFLSLTSDKPRKYHYTCAGLIFVFTFGNAYTYCRGALLALIVGLFILWLVNHQKKYRKRWLMLLIILICAYLIPTFYSPLLLEKNTVSGVAGRTIIWSPSFKLWLHHLPWYGSGLGSYFKLYPGIASPRDSGAWFYVHDDYLQTLIELGIPGLVLLVSILVSVARYFIKFAIQPEVDATKKLMATGLFAGIFTVAAHSLVTFNFYIPIMNLVVGMMLGYLMLLISPQQQIKIMHIKKYVRSRVFYLVVIALLFLALNYLSWVYLSYRYQQLAVVDIKQGRGALAYEKLNLAGRLFNTANIDVLKGNILSQAIQAQKNISDKRSFFQHTLTLYQQAIKADPYSSYAYSSLALFYMTHQKLSGSDYIIKAEAAYRKAIAINPRILSARIQYAALLADQGRMQQALAVMNRAIDYGLYISPASIHYLQQYYFLLKHVHDNAEAAKVSKYIAFMKQHLAAKDLRMNFRYYLKREVP